VSALRRLGLSAAALASREVASAAQEQTRDAFAFKWAQRHTYESDAVKANARAWLVDRYCEGDVTRLDAWLAGERKLVLDAGCGSGFTALLLFGERLKGCDYLGVDISSAVDVARRRFSEAGLPGEFLQADLMNLPIPDAAVDLIYSEGVLHHTDSTERAIHALARKLKTGGRFAFYVYARKAALREFSDDYIRQLLRDMSDEEAWQAIGPLTRLGMALGRLNVEIDVPEDIPLLGIKKGRLDIQRFIYWNVCKLYYRPEYSFDEMNHVNFDWFRPLNCHRHTPEELECWVRDAGMRMERLKAEEAGITVIAVKE
jgi:SAM-dependent methyltransferase